MAPIILRIYPWNPRTLHRCLPGTRLIITNVHRLQPLWARELIAKLDLLGFERVIDIGCGDGKVTAVIASTVPKGTVTGIDNSPEMIGFAQQHFPRTRHPNLTFIQMDARHLTFSEEFDIVFSNASLHWLSDHRPVLEGIERCLVHGGRVILQMGGKGNADKIFKVLGVMLDISRWRKYFDDFTFTYGFFDATSIPVIAGECGTCTRKGGVDP